MAPSKKRKRMTTPDVPSIQSPHHDRYRSPPPVGRSLQSRTLPVATHTTFTPINAATTPPIAAATAATPTADTAAPATPTAADAGAATAPTAAAPATPTAAAAVTPRGYASPSAATTPGGIPSTAASSSAAPPQTTWHPCHDLPPFDKKVSGVSVAFSRRPAVRQAVLRDQNRVLLLSCQSNREAYMAQCVGVLSAAPCVNCEKNDGPWDQCVSVAGFLVGSCANCHYGREGTRCSLRTSLF